MLYYFYSKLDDLYDPRSWQSVGRATLTKLYKELSDAYAGLVQSSVMSYPQTIRRLILEDVCGYPKCGAGVDPDRADCYELWTSCLYLSIILILTTAISKVLAKKPISIKLDALSAVKVVFSYNQATKVIRLQPIILLEGGIKMQTLQDVFKSGSLSTLTCASLLGDKAIEHCIDCYTWAHQLQSLPSDIYWSFKDIALGFKKLNEEFNNNLLSAIEVSI